MALIKYICIFIYGRGYAWDGIRDFAQTSITSSSSGSQQQKLRTREYHETDLYYMFNRSFLYTIDRDSVDLGLNLNVFLKRRLKACTGIYSGGGIECMWGYIIICILFKIKGFLYIPFRNSESQFDLEKEIFLNVVFF